MSQIFLTQAPARGRVLARFEYPDLRVERGYANRTLHVDLSANTIEARPVSEIMKETFIGGRGFGLKLLWDAVTPETTWDDPENAIVISSGPLGGTMQFPGSGKSIVVTLAPATGVPIDSNVGGHFGPILKFSGWDALEVKGQAERDVIVAVEGNDRVVTVEEAPEGPSDSYVVAEQLHAMFARDEADRQYVSTVSAGPGAEHTWMGCLNFSYWDWRRKSIRLKQAGRGGTGTVFRHKKIKALVVRKSGWRPKWTIVSALPSAAEAEEAPLPAKAPLPPVSEEPPAKKEPDKKKPSEKKTARKKPAIKRPAKKKTAKKKK